MYNKLIQNFILTFVIFFFLIYIVYIIYVSILNDKIPENINPNKLLTIKITALENDVLEMYKEPTKEEYIKVDININGKEIKNCGLRTKGSSSYDAVKKTSNQTKFGYRLELDYFIEDQCYDGVSKFYINNGITDKTYVKEMVAFDIYEKVGVKVPKRSFCELSINGKNDGIFTLVEIADDEFIRRNYGINNGIIYKPKINSETFENELVYLGNDFDNYSMIMNGEKFGKSFTRKDMESLINSLKIVSENKNLEDGVDVEATINYFVGSLFIANDDTYTSPTFRNFYIYQENDKISILPYDLNLYFRGENINKPILYYNIYKYSENKPLVYNILSNPIYQEQYKNKMLNLVEEIEQEDFINSRIDVYKNLIDESIKNNSNNFYSYEDFNIAIDAFKRVFEKRTNSVKKQLEANLVNKYIKYEEEIGEDLYLINAFYSISE